MLSCCSAHMISSHGKRNCSLEILYNTNQLKSKNPNPNPFKPESLNAVEKRETEQKQEERFKGRLPEPSSPSPSPSSSPRTPPGKEAAELTGEGLVGRGPLRGGASAPASAWKEHQEEAAAPQPHGATATTTTTTPAARRHPAEPSRSFLAAELRKSRAEREREEAHCEKRWFFFLFFLFGRENIGSLAHGDFVLYVYIGEKRARGWDPPVSIREWWPARGRLGMGPPHSETPVNRAGLGVPREIAPQRRRSLEPRACLQLFGCYS